MSLQLLPLSSMQIIAGNFTVWFYTRDNSIRKSDEEIVWVSGMRSGWYVRFLDKTSPKQGLKSRAFFAALKLKPES